MGFEQEKNFVPRIEKLYITTKLAQAFLSNPETSIADSISGDSTDVLKNEATIATVCSRLASMIIDTYIDNTITVDQLIKKYTPM
jgi:hypothetical protein